MSDYDDQFLSDFEEAFLPFAIASGMLKADDEKADDYKGSVEHQLDLTKRLGLNIDDWDPDNEEVTTRFGSRFIRAQFEGKDESGEPLFVRDMWLLGAMTGRG